MTNKSIALAVPVLPVRDLTRAIEFYHRLGFSSKRYKDGDNYAFTQRDGHELHLRRFTALEADQNPASVYFYLIEGTAAALEAEFRATGITIREPLAPREWKMNEFALNDPDGNQLVFGENVSST